MASKSVHAVKTLRRALADAFKPAVIMVVMTGCGACAAGIPEMRNLVGSYGPGRNVMDIQEAEVPFKPIIIERQVVAEVVPRLNTSNGDTLLKRQLTSVKAYPTYIRLYSGDATQKVGSMQANQVFAFTKGNTTIERAS